MNSRLVNQITVERGISETEEATRKKVEKSSVKHVGPLPSAPTVGVLTLGATPMSEFLCMFPFPDGDAR